MASDPLCSCIPAADGDDSDGCVLHDLPLSGLFIGDTL